jgi:hypothetical protein
LSFLVRYARVASIRAVKTIAPPEATTKRTQGQRRMRKETKRERKNMRTLQKQFVSVIRRLVNFVTPEVHEASVLSPMAPRSMMVTPEAQEAVMKTGGTAGIEGWAVGTAERTGIEEGSCVGGLVLVETCCLLFGGAKSATR